MHHDFVLKQRDRFSLELKLRHILDGESRKTGRYDADIYLFLPQSFHISEETYPRSTFYQDLKLYLRFNTPRFSPLELTDPASTASPLARLEHMAKTGTPSQGEAFARRFDYECRMIGSIYKSTLRDAVRELSRLLDQEECSSARIHRTIEEVEEVPRRVHALARRVTQEITAQELIDEVQLTDEHVSLLFERYLLSLLHIVGSRAQGGSKEAEDHTIEAAIKREIAYRTEAGYPSVPTSHDEAHLEQYVYREKMLKRFASQVLFLNAKTSDEAKRTEHVLYAVAAGIAMVFATAVAFYGQSVYGNLTITFFVLLVASYMLKDRIKEFFKDFFAGYIGRSFYDRRTGLYDTRRKRKLGVVRERAHYKTGSTIPGIVRRARDRGSFERQVAGEDGETVFVYNKRVSLRSARLHKYHRRIEGLADISVLELRRFMEYLAVQHGTLPEVDESGSVTPRRVPRMYHLNIVLHLRSREGEEVHRFRAVVNAKGIHRVEAVTDTVSPMHVGGRTSYIGGDTALAQSYSGNGETNGDSK